MSLDKLFTFETPHKNTMEIKLGEIFFDIFFSKKVEILQTRYPQPGSQLFYTALRQAHPGMRVEAEQMAKELVAYVTQDFSTNQRRHISLRDFDRLMEGFYADHSSVSQEVRNEFGTAIKVASDYVDKCQMEQLQQFLQNAERRLHQRDAKDSGCGCVIA